MLKYTATLYLGICALGQTGSFATALMLVGLGWMLIIEERANDQLRKECLRMGQILAKVDARLLDAEVCRSEDKAHPN